MRPSAARRRRAETDAHLLVSLGLHLNAASVPSPVRISLPDPDSARPDLEVLVARIDLPTWLDSVEVLDEWTTSMRVALGDPWAMHHFRCRLPSSGTTVTVNVIDRPGGALTPREA